MIKAKKSLGQNFLVNLGVLDKIVAAAEINSNDTILEIGPGTGNLTEKLVQKAGQVIAIEKDHRLIEGLAQKFGKNTGFKIIEGDILRLNIKDFTRFNLVSYKVVGNIPYYITSHLLRTIFEDWPMPKLIVLTIQKEVAQRIVAKPGQMSLLALMVQLHSDPKMVGMVSRGSFRPIPNVDSAIIKLTPSPKADKETIEKIMGLAKKAFAGKRKQLKNTLGTNSTSRPEDLDVSDWLNLSSQV